MISDHDKLALAAAYTAATSAGDLHAVARLTEPDAVVWHNYDDAEVDAAQSTRMLSWLHRALPDLTWKDVAVLATAEGYVRRTILTGTGRGGAVRVQACMVVTLSESGKIARIDEYLDSTALAALSE